MKLAVVGGGSTYTPELVDGFARLRDSLPVEELALIDPDTHRLELVGGLARRIFAKQGHPGRVVTTSDLEAGVAGADAVLLQLRVGGQAARNQDETWPLECGCIGQETTGAGGLAKAMRTVPVVLDIAERVEAHAEVGGVLAQGVDLGLAHRVGDRLVPVQRGDVVVLGCKGQVRAPDLPAGEAEAVERLGAGDLVDEVEVDVEEVRLPCD